MHHRLFLFLFILTGFVACDDEELPNTELIVNVRSTEDQPVSEGEVTIYPNLKAFQDETSPMASGKTDPTGSITFKGLKPNLTYYVNIRSGNRTNWISTNTTPFMALGMNQMEVEIKENWYSNLCTSTGKSWSPKYVLIDDIWYTYLDCFNDDVYVFYKNWDMWYANGIKCDPQEIAYFSGEWFGAENQVSMYSDQEGDPGISFKLLESGPDYFFAELRQFDGTMLIVYFE